MKSTNNYAKALEVLDSVTITTDCGGVQEISLEFGDGNPEKIADALVRAHETEAIEVTDGTKMRCPVCDDEGKTEHVAGPCYVEEECARCGFVVEIEIIVDEPGDTE